MVICLFACTLILSASILTYIYCITNSILMQLVSMLNISIKWKRYSTQFSDFFHFMCYHFKADIFKWIWLAVSNEQNSGVFDSWFVSCGFNPPSKAPVISVKMKLELSLLSTDWFQGQIQAWFHNQTKIDWRPYGRLT